MNYFKTMGHFIMAMKAQAQEKIAGTKVAMHEGNMGVVAGVISIVAVVVTLIIGTILAGAFTTVATSANLGLTDTWKAAVNATGNTAITSFNIASLLPIAIVAGLVIAVISVIVVSRANSGN